MLGATEKLLIFFLWWIVFGRTKRRIGRECLVGRVYAAAVGIGTDRRGRLAHIGYSKLTGRHVRVAIPVIQIALGLGVAVKPGGKGAAYAEHDCKSHNGPFDFFHTKLFLVIIMVFEN